MTIPVFTDVAPPILLLQAIAHATCKSLCRCDCPYHPTSARIWTAKTCRVDAFPSHPRKGCRGKAKWPAAQQDALVSPFEMLVPSWHCNQRGRPLGFRVNEKRKRLEVQGSTLGGMPASRQRTPPKPQAAQRQSQAPREGQQASGIRTEHEERPECHWLYGKAPERQGFLSPKNAFIQGLLTLVTSDRLYRSCRRDSASEPPTNPSWSCTLARSSNRVAWYAVVPSCCPHPPRFIRLRRAVDDWLTSVLPSKRGIREGGYQQACRRGLREVKPLRALFVGDWKGHW